MATRASDVATRTEKRGHLSVEHRVERLEEDADTTDENYATLLNRMDRLNGILIGLLISIVTGTVVMLITTAGGGG